MAGNVIEVVLRGKDELSHAFTSAGRNLRNFTLAVAAFTASAGVFLKAGIEFEKLMSGVAAATEATTKEFQLLEAQARRIGQTTPISARNAAEGMKLLGQAGFTANEILASMSALIDLTIAGEVDMTQATDIAASAIRGFSLDAREASRVVDVLAIGAIKSNTDIAGLAEALKYVTPVAAAAGITIEEVSASLAILADRGLRGSLAGTNLAFAIQQLLKPETEEAQAAIDRLGIRILDATGKMTNFENIIEQLAESGATTADIMEIFGTRSGRAILNLVNAGAPALKQMVAEMYQGVGAGSEFARVMSDNLYTSLRKIMNVVEAVQITFFKAFGPQFRQMTDNVIIPLIRQFNDWVEVNRELLSSKIGEFLNNTAERIRLLAKDAQEGTGLLGLFLGVLGRFVDGLAAFGRAYGQLPRIVQEAGIIFAVLGGRLGRIVIVGSVASIMLEGLSTKLKEIVVQFNELKKHDPNVYGQGITDVFAKIANAIDRLLGLPTEVGGELDNLTQTFKRMQPEAEAVPDVLADIDAAFRSISGRVQKLRPSIEAAKNTFAQLWEGIKKGAKDGVDAIGSFKTIGVRFGKDVVEATRTGLSGALFNVFKGETDKIKDVWNAFLDDLLRAFTKAIADMVIIVARDEILKPLLGKGAGLLGGAFNQIAGFFGFAEGGVVKQPTLGLLGEAGPEAVIPIAALSQILKTSIEEALVHSYANQLASQVGMAEGIEIAAQSAAAEVIRQTGGVAGIGMNILGFAQGPHTIGRAAQAALSSTGSIAALMGASGLMSLGLGAAGFLASDILLGKGQMTRSVLGMAGVGAFRGRRATPEEAGLANLETIKNLVNQFPGFFSTEDLINATQGNPDIARDMLFAAMTSSGVRIAADASGRFITGPSLRLVGEAGSEHILNVDSPASVRALREGLEPIISGITGGGVSGITVNIFNPNVRSDDDLRVLVDRVSEELGRRMDVGRRTFLRA